MKLLKSNSFKQRSLSALGIVAYFLIIFIFSWLGDRYNNWSPISSPIIKSIFAWLQYIFFLPIFIFGIIEVNSIYFKNNKKIYYLHLFLILLITTTVFVILVCCQYYCDWWTAQKKTFYFLLAFFVSFFVFNIVYSLYLHYHKKLLIHETLIQMFLLDILCLFSISFFYISIAKSWSTLLLIFLLPVLNDTCAYIGGSLFGKNKLAPQTSPKKTIEGAIFGIIATICILLAILVSYSFASCNHNMLKDFFGVNFKKAVSVVLPDKEYAAKPLWWVNVIVILITLSTISIIGDLSFSAIKRKYQIKDFSNLIPGHGGILDRFDSHSFVYTLYFIIIVAVGFFSQSSSIFEESNSSCNVLNALIGVF